MQNSRLQRKLDSVTWPDGLFLVKGPGSDWLEAGALFPNSMTLVNERQVLDSSVQFVIVENKSTNGVFFLEFSGSSEN